VSPPSATVSSNDASTSAGVSSIETILYKFKGGTDGDTPIGLIELNGSLYGITSSGGTPENAGTVFEVSTSGTERVVYNFKGDTEDGAVPGSLITANGVLYGVTGFGGIQTPVMASGMYMRPPLTRGFGTIFKVSPRFRYHL
jgi:uncharacterized repeat protein (TIGR03803 family)